MAAPNFAVAPWATTADLCSPCDDYAFDVALLEDCLQAATDVLFVLSGQRYTGAVTDVVRPSSSCAHLGPRHGDRCGACGWPARLRLPRTPVVSITEVKVDGAVVAPARYRVENYRDLVYLPESDSSTTRHWPLIQRLELAVTEDDTWQVTYVAGVDPPAIGRRAAAELGCQLALACQPETVGECQLPRGIVNVARQGVTVALADPTRLAELFRAGSTGLPVCDLFLGAELARARTRPATVRVPGRRRGFHRAT